MVDPLKQKYGSWAPVSTARTPGMAEAFEVSIETIRAAGCGEVTMRAWSMPGSVMSWTNWAVPQTLASPSTRAVEPPTYGPSGLGAAW